MVSIAHPVVNRPAPPDMSFSMHRRQLLLAAALVVAGSARATQSIRTDWPRRQRTPASTLPLLGGATWSLAEQRGHAVLLNFWASWCEPCVAEMPSLARLAEREQASGLRVVAANYREPVDTVRRFLDATPLSPAIAIALDRDATVARSFDVHAFPSTVAIGADGRVRFVVTGECDWSDARSRRWVDELVGRRG